MLQAIEGIYQDGRIELAETPADVRKARVIVTFLETETEPAADKQQVSDALLRELLTEGLISHIPTNRSELTDNFKPVDIVGEPLSETVVRERR